MRPKARGLARNGGPPGWMEESDPTVVVLYVMDGPYRLPFPYRTGCSEGAAQLLAAAISICCYIINKMYTTHAVSLVIYTEEPMFTVTQTQIHSHPNNLPSSASETLTQPYDDNLGAFLCRYSLYLGPYLP